tara:strand:- start:92 stop:502 length:411 start_codon:yes stop_codon:yes gene_type:complete
LPGFEGTIDLVASNEPVGFLDSSAFNLNSGFQPIQSASEDKSTPGIEHDRNYGKLIIARQQYRDGGQVDHKAPGEVITQILGIPGQGSPLMTNEPFRPLESYLFGLADDLLVSHRIFDQFAGDVEVPARHPIFDEE